MTPTRTTDRLRAAWGDPVDDGALKQIHACMADGTSAVGGVLMADHHLGYSMPVGGVIAYDGKVSPSSVGYDIGCGNKAVRVDLKADDVRPRIAALMDEIWEMISFGIGRRNKEPVSRPLFEDDPAWDLSLARQFHNLARTQLGTVGSGNHYVDSRRRRGPRLDRRPLWLARPRSPAGDALHQDGRWLQQLPRATGAVRR
jgi:tRNA-splicing ligase RtcB